MDFMPVLFHHHEQDEPDHTPAQSERSISLTKEKEGRTGVIRRFRNWISAAISRTPTNHHCYGSE